MSSSSTDLTMITLDNLIWRSDKGWYKGQMVQERAIATHFGSGLLLQSVLI